MRTPRTFMLGPSPVADAREVEEVKRAVVDVLAPLDPAARVRALEEAGRRIEAHAASGFDPEPLPFDEYLRGAVGTDRWRTLMDGSPLAPERHKVIEAAYRVLCRNPLSKRDAIEAFGTLTEQERAMVAKNLREEIAKAGIPSHDEDMEMVLYALENPKVYDDAVDRALEERREPMASTRVNAVLDELDHWSTRVDRENRRKLLDQRKRIVSRLAVLDSTLKAEVDPFLRFCASVRGYELGPEPGAHLMALGRLFLGEEETAATDLAEFLEGTEKAAKLVGWERFAPNAKQCFDYLRQCCDNELGAFEVLFARRWARSGFAVIEMGHRTAASLMFTHGSGEIESPWPAFVLKVPDGLVVLESYSKGKHATLARVLVLPPSERKPHWALHQQWRCAADGKIRALHVPMKTLDGELTEPVGWDEFETRGVHLKRAVEMVGRLVAGACMLATAKVDIEERPWRPKAKSERRRVPGVEPPAGTRFIVTKNVGIDLRDQVHEYVEGKSRTGAKLTVQFVVRGHRRWQACGPKHTERKLIWVNPYWKGPEEGRALVRGYELKEPGGPSGGQPE